MKFKNEHGGDIYSYFESRGKAPLDFSSNVNPLGIPKSVKKVLKNSLSSFSQYPDVNCRELKKAISIFDNVRQSHILPGNGAADLIFRICNTLKPRKAMIIAPTFSEYESALLSTGCDIDYYHLAADDGFKIKSDILEFIGNKDIMFICNPNNPTGNLVDEELLLQILLKCQSVNCVLVVDECFMDFVSESKNQTMKKYLDKFDCLVILKAFTKIFALAGLRLGYCLSSNKKLLGMISNAGQPWCVSVPAQIAGAKAVKEKEYIQKTLINTEKERNYLMDGLRDLKIEVFESKANYILIRAENLPGLYKKLYEKGILIRKCENFKGLNADYFRIAVKRHKDNIRLIKEIKKIREENSNA